MPVRSCRVTIRDIEGVDHTIQVTASTLYEAVALGLASVRGEEWVGGIAQGVNTVKVAVTNVPIEHSVKIDDFNKWVTRDGGPPKERFSRARVREILGITVTGAR
jgi:hypothetical protein